jgi:site-specific recombinase XerD
VIWEHLAEEYLGRSTGTTSTRISLWLALSQFLAHLPWEVQKVHQLTRRHLSDYRAWLWRQALEPATMYARYLEIRVFLRWAYNQGAILIKLGEDDEEKNPPRRLFGRYSRAQMRKLLEQPPQDSLRGQLDRFVMELFYGTGLRSEEARRLRLADLVDEGLWVRRGKGGKDRFVPIGPFLADQVQHYLNEIRPRLGPADGQESLLLNTDGNPLNMRAWAHYFKRGPKNGGRESLEWV